MSYSKIFALVNKKASKKNRHFVSLESRDSFDKKLRKAEDYKTVYGEDLGNLFIPWEIDSSNDTRKGFKGDFEDPKNMGSGETPDQHPLYPFKYNPKESGVLYQQGSVQDSDSLHSLVSSDRYRLGPDIHRDVTSMRGVGLRLPIIAKGWGHDDVGNPVPSGLTRDKFLNSQDPAKPYINGYEVDPKDYIAAPIDFSYNKERKVWTIQHERVFAKLERKGPSPYAWKEVWKKQDTVGSVLGWKYKPSGLNDVDEGFAYNLVESSSGNTGFILPSGEIVELFKVSNLGTYRGYEWWFSTGDIMPRGGKKWQVLQKLDDKGTVGWDWVRAHIDNYGGPGSGLNASGT